MKSFSIIFWCIGLVIGGGIAHLLDPTVSWESTFAAVFSSLVMGVFFNGKKVSWL